MGGKVEANKRYEKETKRFSIKMPGKTDISPPLKKTFEISK